MSINITSLPIDILNNFLCKSCINKFIQNEVFNKNIKKFLIDMIKDNTFNNKIIKISILQDFDEEFNYVYFNDEKTFEYLFSLIEKMDLLSINNILNKYTKNDIWNNSSYYCLSHNNYGTLFYEDINYDTYMFRNPEYIKNIFKNFINYAENTFLSSNYNDNYIYETSYDLIDELIYKFIFSINLDFEKFIFNYGFKNLFYDFDGIDIEYLQCDDGLEIIIHRILKEYLKCNLEEFYDYKTQFIGVINYKNYIYNKLYN